MHRHSRRGMTLIEVLVVLVIITLVMGALSSILMSAYSDSEVDTQRILSERQQLRSDIANIRAERAPGAPAVRAAHWTIDVDATPYASGIWAHHRLDLAHRVVLDVERTDDTGVVVLQLPRGVGEVRDLSVVRGDGTHPTVRFDDHAALIDIAPGAGLERVTASWATTEVDAFAVPPIPSSAVVMDTSVDVQLPPSVYATTEDRTWPAPEVDGDALRWSLASVVDVPPLIVSVPPGRSFLGRVALLSRLTPLGVLLFAVGFWYANEGARPGRLDDFRLGGLLLLAGNYTLFFVVFAVLATSTGLGTPALAVALIVAGPLLALHAAHLTDARLALLCILPLALGTWGTAVGYVWGDEVRALVVLGALVAAISMLTATWRSWSDGRARAAERTRREVAQAEGRRALEQSLEALRGAVATSEAQVRGAHRDLARAEGLGAREAELRRAIARLEEEVRCARDLLVGTTGDGAGRTAAARRAQRGLEEAGERLVMAVGAADEAAAEARDALRVAVAQCERGVEEAALAALEVRTRLAEVPTAASDEIEQALDAEEAVAAAALQLAQSLGAADVRANAVRASRLATRAEASRLRLRQVAAQLTELDQQQADARHCAACGVIQVGGGAFCSGCGRVRTHTLGCTACRHEQALPPHLLTPGWRDGSLHCIRCGAGLHMVAQSARI